MSHLKKNYVQPVAIIRADFLGQNSVEVFDNHKSVPLYNIQHTFANSWLHVQFVLFLYPVLPTAMSHLTYPRVARSPYMKQYEVSTPTSQHLAMTRT